MAAYIWKEVPFMTLMILAVLRGAGFELLDVGRTLKAGRCGVRVRASLTAMVRFVISAP
jgi:ABC-type spermidine/putrescine transport system permease subunit I